MSATNRGGERHPDDFYETPHWATRAILRHLQVRENLCELGCGRGAILQAFLEHNDHTPVYGIELDPGRAREAQERFPNATIIQGDAFTYIQNKRNSWGSDVFYGDTVLMNPPYKLALEFVTLALDMVGPGGEVAALLRLNWLGSKVRAPFHRARPADVFILPKRPSFTPDGKTDACEYAWFVWGPGRGGRWSILDG